MSGSFVVTVTGPGATAPPAFGTSGVSVPSPERLMGVRMVRPRPTFGVGLASAPIVAPTEVALAFSDVRESHGWYSTFLQAAPLSEYVTVVLSNFASTRCAESPRSSHGVMRYAPETVG